MNVVIFSAQSFPHMNIPFDCFWCLLPKHNFLTFTNKHCVEKLCLLIHLQVCLDYMSRSFFPFAASIIKTVFLPFAPFVGDERVHSNSQRPGALGLQAAGWQGLQHASHRVEGKELCRRFLCNILHLWSPRSPHSSWRFAWRISAQQSGPAQVFITPDPRTVYGASLRLSPVSCEWAAIFRLDSLSQ